MTSSSRTFTSSNGENTRIVSEISWEAYFKDPTSTDEEPEEAMPGEVNASTGKFGEYVSISCGLCGELFEATIVYAGLPKKPGRPEELTLIYESKECDCPDIGYRLRQA
jgi:hypothetical protein